MRRPIDEEAQTPEDPAPHPSDDAHHSNQAQSHAMYGTSESPADSVSHPETIGPFHIVRPLGHGGMGEVYLARQKVLNVSWL